MNIPDGPPLRRKSGRTFQSPVQALQSKIAEVECSLLPYKVLDELLAFWLESLLQLGSVCVVFVYQTSLCNSILEIYLLGVH